MRQLTISRSITSRDSVSLDKYLLDISHQELISAEEESVLAKKIREGDTAALKKLILANLRFVVSVAKQYQHLGLSLPDLVNEGNLGLLKAAVRFDETRGFKFISYAVWWIRQSIIQAIAEQSRTIRLPLNKIGMLNKIRKAKAILEQALERDASPDEIAEKLFISESDVVVAEHISSYTGSLDAPLRDEQNSLSDILYDPMNPMPDQFLMQSSLLKEITRALSKLTVREAEVIVLFFGIGTGISYSLNEIGEKFGLSGERIRQIKEKAIRSLKAKTKTTQLRTYLGE